MGARVAPSLVDPAPFTRIKRLISDPLAKKRFLLAALVLLAGDLVLISADVLQRISLLSDDRFLVTREGGFGEMFQYAKAATASLWLALLAVRRPSATPATWAMLLAVVVIDDALAVHERIGVRMAAALGLPGVGTVRPNHVGELLFFGFMGIVFGGALIAAWRFGQNRDRMLTLALMPSFGALAICAVVLDAISSLTRRSPLAPAFALAEDGGEMIALSVLLSILFACAQGLGLPDRSSKRRNLSS